MNLSSIKKEVESQILNLKFGAFYQNEAGNWFSRIDKDEKIELNIFWYAKNGDLKSKKFNSISAFSNALLRLINFGFAKWQI